MLAALLGALFLVYAVPAEAQTTVWSATLTVKQVETTRVGCSNATSGNECTSALTDHEFTHEGVTYPISFIFQSGSRLALGFGATGLPASVNPDWELRVGNSKFPFVDNIANALTGRTWDNVGLSWTAGDTVSLSIVELPPHTVSLSASPNSILEGSSVAVTATLSRALASQVVIPVTLTDDTAESTDHGTLASITIASGATSGTGMISTNHDADDEDETFTVELDTANLPSEVTAGTSSSVQITIVDDEGIPSVSLSASPKSVPEGDNVKVTATLSEALSESVEIPLLPAWNTGTVETGDIKGPPGTITVFHGKTTGEELVLAVRDCDTDDEMFTVAIDTDRLPSSLRAGTPSSVTITIKDDGVPCTQTPRTPTTETPTTNTGGTGSGGGGGGAAPPKDTTSPEEPSDTPCGESDREYLERFYEATGGENWHENEYWNSQEPLDEWFGVDTDENEEVVSLRLADNNLSGDMPTEELLCLNENTELKELALWDNDDLSGEVPEDLALAVERAALRYIADMFNINPEWFEDYEDPFNFEDWHEGVTTDDEERVVELVLPGEIPESIRSQFKKREITITTSSEGGCALSPEGSSAFSLFLLTLVVFAVVGRKRAR